MAQSLPLKLVGAVICIWPYNWTSAVLICSLTHESSWIAMIRRWNLNVKGYLLMNMDEEKAAQIEHLWRTYLTTGEFAKETRQRQFFRLLPGHPRCKNCYAPFSGAGGQVVKLLYGKRPANMNPRLCNVCEVFAAEYQGGADIELTMLFVDVRGSTTLAEQMSPMQYGQLINRFYSTVTRIMIWTDALIDKIIGDQAAGMYVPGFAGSDHAKKAMKAAQDIMKATGHGTTEGPWISLGAGVHTGVAFVGSLGSEDGTSDITVLGDAANTTARLSSHAGVGEILISKSTCSNLELETAGLEQRDLELKGKSERVSVCVLKQYESVSH
jgi:adenylate cyclase